MNEAQLSAVITADVRDALKKIETVEKTLGRLTKTDTQIKANINAKSVESQLDAILKSARALQKASAKVTVEAQAVQARRELGIVQKQIDDLRKNANIKITVTGAARIPQPNFKPSASTLDFSRGVSRDELRVLRDWNAAIAENERRSRAAAGGVREIGRAAKESNSWLSKTKETILAFGTGYLVIQGIGAALGALSNTLIGYNSMLEKSSIAFTTLMDGNQQAADKFLGKLREFAAVTPFEYADLVPLTQKLIALGVVAENEIQKKTIPALTAISNATSALGAGPQAIESIVRALGQMAQKGKASAEEVTQQLAEVGINGAKYIADALGTSTAEVFEQMKKGAINGKAAVDAILYGMANDPKFKDMAQKFASTFEGAMSNVRDVMRDAVGSGLGGPLFKHISEQAQRFAKILASPAFQSWAKETGPKIANVAIAIGRFFGGIINYGMKTFAVLKFFAQTVWPTVAKAAQSAMKFISENWRLTTFGIIGGVLKSSKGVTSFWDVVKLAGKGIIGVLRLVHTSFMSVAEVATLPMRLLNNSLQQLLDAIPQNLVEKLLGADAAQTFNTFRQSFKAFSEGFDMATTVAGANKMWDGIQSAFDKGVDGISQSWGMAWKDLKNVWSSAGFDSPEWKKIFNQKFSFDFGLENLTKPTRDQLLQNGDDKGAAARKRRAALLKLEKDQLADAQKAWQAYGDAVVKSATRQLDAIEKLADVFRDFFGALQNKLLQMGVTNDPLAPVIANVSKLLGLDAQAKSVQGWGIREATRGYRNSDIAASILDRKNGGDGYNPGRVSTRGVEATAAMVEQIARSVKTSRGQQSCAFVASEVLKGIGINIKGSPVAKTLVDQMLAARARRIPLSQSRPGDLVVQSGARFGAIKYNGIGYHVTSAIGGGQVVGSSLGKFQKYTPVNGNPYALTLRGATSPTVTSTRSGIQVATSVSNGITGIGGIGGTSGARNLDDLRRQVNTSLSTFAAVPKAWSTAVKDTETTTARFLMQTKLATVEFQQQVRNAAAERGISFDQMVMELRDEANAADVVINKFTREWQFPEKAKARYESFKRGIDAIKERAQFLSLERDLMRRGITDQQERNELLDIERQRRERVNELIEAGYNGPMAKRQADKEAAENKKNLQREKELARISEVAQANAERTSSAYNTLAEALGNVDINAASLSQTLAAMPLDTLANRDISRLATQARDRINVLRADEGARGLLDNAQQMASEYSNRLKELQTGRLPEVENLTQQRAAAINSLYAQQMMAGPNADVEKQKNDVAQLVTHWDNILRDARQYAEITQNDAFNNWAKEHNRRLDLMLQPDGIKRQLAELKYSLEDQGIKDPVRIKAILDMQQEEFRVQEKLDFWRQVSEGISGAFGGSLNTMLTTTGSVFSRIEGMAGNMVRGIADSFLQLSQKILQDWLMQQLLGAFMPSAGGAASAINSFIAPGGGGGIGKVSGGLFGHANGLASVPYDNYVARLHRDEAVLTATQARQWRAQRADLALAGSASSTRGGRGSATTFNITVNGVRDAENVPREIERQMSQRAGRGLSRGEMARQHYETSRAGQGYE